MSHEKPAARTFPAMIRSKNALVLLFVLLVTACAAIWWYDTKFTRWSDVRELPGVICSVAAGTLPDGREIVVVAGKLQKPDRGYGNLVCCYDAGSGKVLWESHGGNSHFNDLEYLQVWVAMDAQGDVFTASPFKGDKTAKLEKRSGADGRLLWSMDFRYPGNFKRGGHSMHYHFLPPLVNRKGDVWLLGTNTTGPSDKMQVSLVNGRTGDLISAAPVAEVQEPQMQFMDFIGLDGGGAVLVHMQGNVRHVSLYSEDGIRIGGFPIPYSTRASYLVEFRLFVDERNQRLFVCDEIHMGGWSTVDWVERELHASGYSMTTGGKLWDASKVVDGQWGTLRGRIPELVRLRPDGELELRHATTEDIKKINWRKWTKYKGLPVPERKTEKKNILLTTTIHGVNGSHGAPEVIKTSESWFYRQGKESGSSTKEERYNLDHSMQAGTVMRCRDSRRWLPVELDGRATGETQCFRMIRCPSGRVVLTRDPRDFLQGYRDKLWHVRSPE